MLRVGMDTGTDGALGPLFEDGRFEYVPPGEWEKTSGGTRFAQLVGRNGKPLMTYLPKRLAQKIVHNDPEWSTFSYGDQGAKTKWLRRLEPGDYAVFYVGLRKWHGRERAVGLYIIGYFTIEKMIDTKDLSEHEVSQLRKRYPANGHFAPGRNLSGLVLIAGRKGESRLMEKAIPISIWKRGPTGRPYEALSARMEKALGIRGGIQRSLPPRTIVGGTHIRNLQRILGVH